MKLGIDLGTYNSAAAYVLPDLNGQGENEYIQVLSRSGGNNSGKQFPSFVKFDRAGIVEYTGEPARNALLNEPNLVVWGAKRLVGRSYSQAAEKRELERFRYPIEQGEGDTILIPQGNEKYTPAAILKFILREIKRDAEDPKINPILAGHLNSGTINEAVITVPAYYDAFRYNNHLNDAAKDAGFEKISTRTEPLAAALRYGLQISGNATILAFDMGAGTLDISVLRVARRGHEFFAEDTVTSGNPEFGGIDI